MNSADTQKLWEETLELLRAEISPINYKGWIEPLEFSGLDGSCIILCGSDLFNATAVRKRYISILTQAVHRTFGEEYEVYITCPGEKAPQRSAHIQFNPQYTFETFVVGSNNRLAQAAAIAVAEMPAEAYNPLFLYGGVGLGKTHLIHAIGNQILKNDPSANLLYLTSEEFTNMVITAIEKHTNQELRDKLRYVDVLMVDDIQFIAGKTATQEEFFHTFNQLYNMKKQIIISSDRPPREIPTLEERLRSRFEWGLVADIGKPDYETRIAILNRKAEGERRPIPSDVISFIAENVQSNIRELEGALTRVTALADLNHSEVTLDLARESLGNIIQIRDPRRITAQLIKQTVCSHYGVTVEDMDSTRRSREISDPRQIAMYLCREMTELSTTRIGAEFGKRDHTTVMHACEKIEESIEKDMKLRAEIQLLRRKITEG